MSQFNQLCYSQQSTLFVAEDENSLEKQYRNVIRQIYAVICIGVGTYGLFAVDNF